MFDTLRLLQARGCEVTGEVRTLLRTGYASAAHARWRTLHETAVTAFFVADHGKDIAEQYRLHEYVEAWTAADKYQKHCKRLRHEPYTDEEMAAFNAARDQVVGQFHPRFGDPYGWAASTLGRTGKKDESHLRRDRGGSEDGPLAAVLPNGQPRANPKAITFSLGKLRGEDVILTGPSLFGLTDPGHAAAIALLHLTTILLMRRPGIHSRVTIRALGQLVDEIGDEFLAAAKAVEERARSRAASSPPEDETP